ncbi:MAG: AAA-like domain-containing protein [Chthoniobacteraceae bacterium]
MNDSFFKVGGTLASDAPCYVERQADRDLLDALRRGEFCYVLDTRQFGKSSLMSRAASVLRAEGTLVTIIDLNALGESGNAEQWYFGMLDHLGEQLGRQGLQVLEALEKHWTERAALAPMQRLMNALRDIVLPATTRRLVIMVDEIDYVRKLARLGTDEFFAGIRECYNRRARDPEFERVTFCLLGVASPSDLIKDSRVTPFNIGTRIELRDFTAGEAATLKAGFDCSGDAAEQILARVLHWTGGHPYLTQRLCRAVAEDCSARSAADVDRHCEELFLASSARDRDDNLLFVRDRMLRGTGDLVGLLELYRAIRKGRAVPNDDANPLVSDLRLAGIVRPADGRLEVRNRIYAAVFEPAWIDKAMPDAERRRQRRALLRGIAVATGVFLIGAGIWHVLFVRAWVEYYDDFERHRDGPRGFGKLTQSEVQHRPNSLRFTRRGWLGRLARIEHINGLGQLSKTDTFGSWIFSGREDDSPAQRVVTINYSHDGRALRSESGRNIYGNEVWRFEYERPAGDGSITGVFRANGSVQAQAPSGASHVKLIFDPQGWVLEERFNDGMGQPRPDGYRCFGFRRERDAVGHEVRRTALGPDGKPGWHKNGWTTFEFEFDARGFVSRTRHLDLDGNPFDPDDGTCEMQRKRDSFGNIVERRLFDASGKPATDSNGIHLRRMTFDAHGFETEVAYFDTQDRPANFVTEDSGGYARYTAEHDANGCRIGIHYFDTEGNPVLTRSGHAAVTYSCDAFGNQWWTQYFDADGKPTIVNEGYSAMLRQFDERGRQITSAGFDATGMPTPDTNGVFWADRQWDDLKLVQTSYFGTDGRPTRHNEGYAITRWNFRDPINRFDWTERTYLDADEKSTSGPNNASRVTRRYDGANLVEETFWSAGNLGALTNAGARGPASPESSRTDAAAKTPEPTAKAADSALPAAAPGSKVSASATSRVRRFDVGGEELSADAVMSPDGYSRYTRAYDILGNPTSTTYFAFAGGGFKPTSTPSNDHRIEYEYDPHNRTRLVCTRAFGVDGLPTCVPDLVPVLDRVYGRFGKIAMLTLHHGDGRVSKKRTTYDDAGRRIESTFLDGEGNLLRSSKSHTIFREAYDPRGNLTRESWFDADGKPAAGPEGVAAREYGYDTRDRRIEMRSFAKDGKPSREGFIFASYRETLDERGRLIERRYFDADGKPTPNAVGAARVGFSHDARGRVSEESYFDTEERPTNCKDGYALKRMTYDARGQLDTESYFDADMNPTRSKDGVQRTRLIRDESGHTVEKRLEGADPARGFNLIVMKLDPSSGRTLERAIFDAAGAPASTKTDVPRQRYEYDPKGKLTHVAYLDASGAPFHIGDGYTDLSIEYDDEGLVKMRRWTGFPKQLPFAINLSRYNAAGEITDDDYLDANAKPARGPSGWASMRGELDAQGRTVRLVWLDPAGKQDRGTAMFSEVRYTYGTVGKEKETFSSGYDPARGYAQRRQRANVRGTLVEDQFLDSEGKPAKGPDGYSLRQTEDDDKGRNLRVRCFDAAGQPTGDAEGYSERKFVWSGAGEEHDVTLTNVDPSRPFATGLYRYDSGSHLIESRYFDADGKPTSNALGAARVRFTNDAKGRVSVESYFDAEGSPATCKEGYALKRMTYNARGQLETESYFDADMNPTRSKDGGLRTRVVHDESGRVIERRYEDTDPALGYALIVMKLDPAGRTTERAIFNAAGAPASTKTVAPLQRYQYDAAGRLIHLAYLDASGLPFRVSDGYTDFYVEYDTEGRARTKRWTGFPPTVPFVVNITRYNVAGDVTNDDYFDANGKPTGGPSGWASMRSEFDTQGRASRMVWLDASGKQARGTALFSEMRYTYGTVGKEKETISSGYDPAKSYAQRRQRTNVRGTLVEDQFLDSNGKPAKGPDGYSLRQTEDDEKGRTLRIRCFDTAGQPAADRDGYNEQKFVWSGVGEEHEITLTNADPSRPFATAIFHYDSANDLIAVRYLAADGAAGNDGDGSSFVRMEKDGKGRIVRTRWLAADGSPARSKVGFNERVVTYDKGGRRTHDVATGFAESSGIAKLVREYNEKNEIARSFYLDAQDKPVQMRIFVDKVMPDGEAARVGLKVGDLLLTYEGHAVPDLKTLREQIGAPGPNRRTLRVWREGKVVPLSVAPGLLGIQLDEHVPFGVPAEAFTAPVKN